MSYVWKQAKCLTGAQSNIESQWTRAVGKELNWNVTPQQLLVLSDWLKSSTSLIHKLNSHWIKVLWNSIRLICVGQSSKFEKGAMLLMRKAVKTLYSAEESASAVSIYHRKRALKNLKSFACLGLNFTSEVGRSSHLHMGIAQALHRVPVPRWSGWEVCLKDHGRVHLLQVRECTQETVVLHARVN